LEIILSKNPKSIELKKLSITGKEYGCAYNIPFIVQSSEKEIEYVKRMSSEEKKKYIQTSQK
jgi:hypothetical protein